MTTTAQKAFDVAMEKGVFSNSVRDFHYKGNYRYHGYQAFFDGEERIKYAVFKHVVESNRIVRIQIEDDVLAA